MTGEKLEKISLCGEDIKHQFKENIHNVDSLAAEMTAFSNSQGGYILIGVTDDRELCQFKVVIRRNAKDNR